MWPRRKRTLSTASPALSSASWRLIVVRARRVAVLSFFQSIVFIYTRCRHGRLRKGWYLLAVTKSQVVAKLLGCTISKVLEAKAFPFSAKKGATDIASGALSFYVACFTATIMLTRTLIVLPTVLLEQRN